MPSPPVPDTASDGPVTIWQPAEQLRRILREIQCMSSYATSRGIGIPTGTIADLANLIKDLGRDYLDPGDPAKPSSAEDDPSRIAAWTATALTVHRDLSALIVPATPETLASNQPVRLPDWPWRYPAVFWIALVGFVAGLALFLYFVGRIDAAPQEAGFGGLNLAGQWACLGASILGSAFYSTFEANKYIVARTYDSRYAGVYVFRFLLGIVAGMILAHFGTALLGSKGDVRQLGVVTLALVGGYSADAVNRILYRVAETLTSMVQGGSEATLRAKDNELKATETRLDARRGRDDDDASKAIEGVLESEDGAKLAPDRRGALERARAQLQHRAA